MLCGASSSPQLLAARALRQFLEHNETTNVFVQKVGGIAASGGVGVEHEGARGQSTRSTQRLVVVTRFKTCPLTGCKIPCSFSYWNGSVGRQRRRFLGEIFVSQNLRTWGNSEASLARHLLTLPSHARQTSTLWGAFFAISGGLQRSNARRIPCPCSPTMH